MRDALRSRRLLAGLAIALGLWGGPACTSFTACERDSDCAGQDLCDPGLKVCYLPTDGGQPDAGPLTACSAGCAQWQTCRPESVASGVCVNASIRALSPNEAVAQTGGNSVTFAFEVTQWDGGMWPGETVPLWKSEGMVGPTVLTKTGSQFQADVQLANHAGKQGVVAGWAAVDAGIFVDTLVCTATCKPYEECVPDAAGGSCADLGLTMRFEAPAEGAEYGPINSQAVPLTLTVTRADGGAFATPVPFEMKTAGAVTAVGALTKTGATWTGVLDGGLEDGTRVLTAGWDGGPGASRSLKVTATPPTIVLISDAPPTRPSNQTDTDSTPRWKKSEVATVRLVSSRDLLLAPTPADFVDSSAVTTSTACVAACTAPRCYCFAVDLARLPLKQAGAGLLWGTESEGLSRQLSDVLGNSGAVDAGVFDVTRLKWSQVVATGTLSVQSTAVAVSSTGLAIVGTNSNSTGAGMMALSPDGGVAWQVASPTEAITAGPVAGQAAVHFAVSNGSQGQLRRLDWGGTTLAPDKCLFAGATYPGDMALTLPDAGEFPLAIARVTSSANASLTSSATQYCTTSDVFGKLAAGVRPSLILNGTNAYVAASNQAPVWKFDSLATTPLLEGNRSTVTLFPSNLFAAGANIVGGGGPTVGGIFSFYDSGGALDGGATVNATPGTYPGGAAVVGTPATSDSRPWVYYGDSNGNVRKARLVPSNPPAFDAAPAPLAVAGADFSSLAPLLGANNKAFVASANVLYALEATTPSEEWHWTAPDAISSQLNLDKNRDAPAPCGPGQPGVLYVVTASGTNATLYAILVDSPGVDSNAPWPRHQHDPANTGNSGTNLTPWVCK